MSSTVRISSPRSEFPRQYARTRRFTLGIPRAITIAPGGGRVLFLRAAGPEDPVTDLWEWTPVGERKVLAAREHVGRAGDDLPAAERERRERLRESAEGVVAYTADRDLEFAATTLGGALLTVDVATGAVAVERTDGPVFDPRLDPTGQRIAFVSGADLHVLPRGGNARILVAEDGVSWGRADFVAAEEMHRHRGFWWSPDGHRIAACRVDEREVPTWWIGDPANPDRRPVPHRYPAAGTTNADVRLAVFDVDGRGRVDVAWDREAFPYLARVAWDEGAPLTLLVQDRPQRRWQVLTVDAETGATSLVQEDADPAWLELVAGTPTWTSERRLVTVRDVADAGERGTRCLVVDGTPVTPAGLQVDAVAGADGTDVWFTAFDGPFDLAVFRYDTASGHLDRVTEGPGTHGVVVRDGTEVVAASTATAAPTVTVRRGREHLGELAVELAEPLVTPRPRFLRLGPRELPGVLLLPTAAADDGPWPVLLSPYGGPGPARARRARRSREPLLEAQWFADQGFAVLAVDNRGMPGVDVAFEKAIAGDLATLALEDQVDALHAAAELEPRIDLGRVGIRGWSFGGFLAALSVLRRPDVFHAGVAGAPVTDWRLYDTHYTERYLGRPDEQPSAYRVSSLVDATGRLVDAAPWEGTRERLLVIHGLADDNVVAAHSLRLSSALLSDGRAHRFLPLSGVTHMTPQEVIAENLLHLQLDFLRRALGADAPEHDAG